MAKIVGNGGNNTLSGTPGNDLIYGLGGDDTLRGQGGNDKLYGGDGGDGLYGEAGNDWLEGGAGIDALFGGAGNDSLFGGSGNDYMDGGAGNDAVYGGVGNDRVRGGAGNDWLDGGTGNDDVNGGSGNDTIVHEAGGLIQAGRDVYAGGSGYDTLLVKAGTATIATSSGTVPATVNINVDYAGSGGTIQFTDGVITKFVDAGTFNEIERFTISEDSRLTFVGGNLDATAIGGRNADTFVSGAGDETFMGLGGGDRFYFDQPTGDTDKIVGFNPAEDVIVSTMWQDSQGTPLREREISESGGHTFVKTYDGGELTHTIDIDTTGIPMDVFKDGFAFG